MRDPRELMSRLAAARPDEAERVRQWLVGAVTAHLLDRRGLSRSVREALDLLISRTDALDDALAAALNLLDPGPFRAEMTVHAAHARHPGVGRIFASRGLPGCPACAVGADETLVEAADAEGFPLADLLADLRGLHT
ncbi:MAG: hypothetical protein EXR71_09100 [Myxococcales bacterium]|nr:hypothetical protein [Myxococcales bacterium]